MHVKTSIHWWQFHWRWTLPVKQVIHKYAVLAGHQHEEHVVVEVDFEMVAWNKARIAHVDVSCTSSTRAPNGNPRLAHQKLCLVIIDESRQRRAIRHGTRRRSTRRLRVIDWLHDVYFRRIFARRIHDKPTGRTSHVRRQDGLFLLLLLSQCQQRKWRPTGVFTWPRAHGDSREIPYGKARSVECQLHSQFAVRTRSLRHSVVDSSSYSSVCLSVCGRGPWSVCTECIVAKTVRPRANANVSRIWVIDWYQNEWPWPLFRGRIKVTSTPTVALHLMLNIWETVRELEWFQRTTNRKWHMGYRMVTWRMTSRDVERSNSWHQYA